MACCLVAGIFLIEPLGTNFSANLYTNLYIFIQENAFENVIWKMVAILSRFLYVKYENHNYLSQWINISDLG